MALRKIQKNVDQQKASGRQDNKNTGATSLLNYGL
jgi:hypothetical protein